MAEIKFTTNELRSQERLLGQLNKYLPTLQLKKAMLQAEIYEARQEIQECERNERLAYERVKGFAPLLSTHFSFAPEQLARVDQLHRRYENIAGVDVPYFDSISFVPVEYSLFDTAPWLDGAIEGIRFLAEAEVRIQVAKEKKEALEKELRMVSIRVNLFEKILIPRAKRNIKKIKVFLGDQELAAVSRAKVAKGKIEKNKQKMDSHHAS